MAYNLGSASGRIELSYNGSTAVRRAQADVGGLTKVMNAAGISAGTLGKMAAIGIGGAVVAGFAVAARSAATFEKQLSAIEAVSGASTKQMEQLRNKSLQLGADTKFSAGEAASAIEELVKAGLSVEEVMGGAADATVSLAAAGEIDLAQAATIASNALNQFNLNASDLPGVVDAIAGAANASAIDVSDLGMSLTQVGAVANLAGASFEDVATAIALMGNAGIRGSDAGTSLKTMFQNLQPQTKKQIDLFKELGILTDDGSNKFFDAEGNVKSYAKVAGVLQGALQGMGNDQKLATLEIMFGTDAIRAAAIAADAGAKGVREMNKEMGKVTAADVAAKRMDNLAGSFEQLTGSIETSLLIAGSPLLVGLRAIVDGLTKGVNAATEFAQGLGEDLSPGLKDLLEAGEHVWNVLMAIVDMFDDLGASSGSLGLDVVVATFNLLASVIETVTGLLEGNEEIVLIVAATWLILANGGIAKVIAQLGWFAAYAVIRALDGLLALQLGAEATATSFATMGAAAASAMATLGAVALLVAAVVIWKAYRDAVNETADALRNANDARKSGDFGAMQDEIDSLNKLIAKRKEVVEDVDVKGLKDTGKFFQNAFDPRRWGDIGRLGEYKDSMDDLEGSSKKLQEALLQMSGGVIDLSEAVGNIDPAEAERLMAAIEEGDPAALEQLEELMTDLQPLLDAAGIKAEDFIAALQGNGDLTLMDIRNALFDVDQKAGGAESATKSLTQAAKDLYNETISAADAAKSLKAALDDLIGVEIGAVEAGIQWRENLRDLKKGLKENGAQILGNTEAADKNKSLVNQSVQSVLDQVEAQAKAGKSIDLVTKTFSRHRKELIASAGPSKKAQDQMREYLKIIKFTPRSVRILFEAVNAEREKNKVQDLIDKIQLTPKEAKTIFEAAGADTAAAKVKALRDYIAQLKDKSINIDTTMTTTHIEKNIRMAPGMGVRGRDGGFTNGYGDLGLESYHSGGLRNLPAGVYNGRRVMFAEPGTGGEAFIPLAQHKRKRSEMLMAQVASMFGGAFVKFAEGGFNNLATGIAASGSKSSDVMVSIPSVRTTAPRSPSAGNLRLIDGKIGFDESGNAYLRGIVEEVVDDTMHYESVIGRMD